MYIYMVVSNIYIYIYIYIYYIYIYIHFANIICLNSSHGSQYIIILLQKENLATGLRNIVERCNKPYVTGLCQ